MNKTASMIPLLWLSLQLSLNVTIGTAFTASLRTTTRFSTTVHASTLPRSDEATIPSLSVEEEKHHFHDFWRKERSSQDIQTHIEDTLSPVTGSSSLRSRVEVLSAEPPLVLIHNFLPKDYCRDIIDAAAADGGFQRSTTGNSQQTSNSRTSSTVWLQDAACPAPLRMLAEKVSLVSGLPPSFMENLQVCRYHPGQQFQLHTDHQDSFNDLDCRGRLATCLVYLAEPTSGGETWFPGLDDDSDDVYVSAQQGSAVFFWNTVQRPGSPSYTPDMFLDTDMRLRHAGLPVLEGEKWICNRWVHPIDFGSGVVGMDTASTPTAAAVPV